MSTSAFFLLLVALFSVANAAYITAIKADSPNGLVYATSSDNVLYEINMATFLPAGFHNTSGYLDYPTLFIARRNNNHRVLYAYLDNGDEDFNFVYYPLPLAAHQDVLAPGKSQKMENGLSLPSYYDKRDMRAVHSVSRNLTLVNLENLNILDSVFQWTLSRLAGRNVVYNHHNKHVTAFYTYRPIHGGYGLSVEEYDVSTNQFFPIDTTYNCLCEPPYNETDSPFFKVTLAEQACDIYYGTHPAQIWCSFPEGQQLFAFNANNLSDFRIVSTPATFDYVVWDFDSGFGYALDGHNEDGSVGFEISKIRLDNGAVLKTFSNSDFRIDASIYDLAPPHLYIAVEGVSSVFSINANTLRHANVLGLGVN